MCNLRPACTLRATIPATSIPISYPNFSFQRLHIPFPSHAETRCSQFQYRLTTCGELSLGIFTSLEDKDPETERPKTPTIETSAPVYSGAPERKAVLLGHIVATKTTNPTVTDADMEIPSPSSTKDKVGHQETGQTICIHSLAVLPDYQGKGLGKTLMKAYLQRMEGQGVAERVALIARQELVVYYEGFGFVNRGKSGVRFGGGGWYDMVKELKGVKGCGKGGEVDEMV